MPPHRPYVRSKARLYPPTDRVNLLFVKLFSKSKPCELKPPGGPVNGSKLVTWRSLIMGGGNAAQAGLVVKPAPAARSDKHDATLKALSAGTAMTLCCAPAHGYRENA
jgi:hypothetical protein